MRPGTRSFRHGSLAVALLALAAPATAQVMGGGAPMYATKDIVDNAVNSKDRTTFVAAVKAAGLVDMRLIAWPDEAPLDASPTVLAFRAGSALRDRPGVEVALGLKVA